MSGAKWIGSDGKKYVTDDPEVVRRRRTPTYDSKCYDLAMAFLSEEPHLQAGLVNHCCVLAWAIQQIIEEYIARDLPELPK